MLIINLIKIFGTVINIRYICKYIYKTYTNLNILYFYIMCSIELIVLENYW